MKTQITLISLLICSLLGGALSLELKLKYNGGFYLPAVIGENHSIDPSCHVQFLINMGPYCATDICKSQSSIQKCGPVIDEGYDVLKDLHYSQHLEMEGFSLQAKYETYCNSNPILNFCSRHLTFPVQLQNNKIIKNTDFYMNLVPTTEKSATDFSKSSILLGEYDPSILKPGTSFLKFDNNFKNSYGKWIMNVKNISFLGQTVEPYDYDTFSVYSWNGLGLSAGYNQYMETIKGLGVNVKREPNLGYDYISASDFKLLPDITYHVYDKDNVLRDLTIPPKFYTYRRDTGEYILQVSYQATMGIPFMYAYYTGFSMTDNIIYVGERADNSSFSQQNSSSSLRKESQ